MIKRLNSNLKSCRDRHQGTQGMKFSFKSLETRLNLGLENLKLYLKELRTLESCKSSKFRTMSHLN